MQLVGSHFLLLMFDTIHLVCTLLTIDSTALWRHSEYALASHTVNNKEHTNNHNRIVNQTIFKTGWGSSSELNSHGIIHTHTTVWSRVRLYNTTLSWSIRSYLLYLQ